MIKVGRVGMEHLCCPVELGRSFGNALAVGACHQHVHVLAERSRCRHRLGDTAAEGLVVMVGEEEDRHDSTPTSLSLATSSAALATLTPAFRPGGSTVLSTLRRGAMSTP